jgi:hypothetical protein
LWRKGFAIVDGGMLVFWASSEMLSGWRYSLMQTAKFTELPNQTPLPSIHQLMQEHSLYDRRLETLRSKMFLTDAEQMEEVRLKKLKLSLKDEMERLRRMGAGLPSD